MGRGILRNLLSFLLVLVLTMAAVSVLSACTKAGPDAAARYSQQVRGQPAQVEEFFAPAQEYGAVPMPEAAGGFLLILTVAGTGVLTLLRGKRRGRQTAGQGYQPKRDMARGAAERGMEARRTPQRRRTAGRRPSAGRRRAEAYPVRRRIV